MVHYCTEVTCLILPKDSQLSLDDLEEIIHTMTHLQELDMFADGFIQVDRWPFGIYDDLLEVTGASVKELTLRVDYQRTLLDTIVRWAGEDNPLPSVVNIFAKNDVTNQLLIFLLTSNLRMPPFEVNVYDNRRIPLNLYPLMPLRKFKFDSKAAAVIILLSHRGIVGLQHDMFYFSEYNHNGTVRHTLTHFHTTYEFYLEKKHFNCTSDLHSVSYVNISHSNVLSYHLEQLAVQCPNLERLNLQKNVYCLQDLQGLHAIVSTCQNLEGLNLVGISASQVESFQLLWELLSSLKKLTHLATDLCMLKSGEQKLVSLSESCRSIQALELYFSDSCTSCLGSQSFCSSSLFGGACSVDHNKDFLFPHFPSLTYCRVSCYPYCGLRQAITDCHQLKYLYEKHPDQSKQVPVISFPFLRKSHVQQLCVISRHVNFSDLFADRISAHGKLECVVLHIRLVTVSSITTLINNSPNLTSLHVFIDEPFSMTECEDADRISKMLSCQKLLAGGSVNAAVVDMASGHMVQDALMNTNLNPLWVTYY